MWFRTLFDSPKPTTGAKTRQMRCVTKRQRPPSDRLRVERLEDRSLMGFSPAYSYGGAGPELVVGDFDGNATADIISTYGAVLLGKGDGTFQPAFYTTPTSWHTITGDFNTDGRLDAASERGVLLGNGDGTLQMPIPLALPDQRPPGYTSTNPLVQHVDALAAGDVNGDNVPDLAVIGSTSYRVFAYYDEYGNPVYGYVTDGYVNVLLGRGDGSFSARSTVHVPYTTTVVAVGDMNNDGRLDVVTNSNVYTRSGVRVMLGNGDGTLQAGQEYGTEGASHLVLGDFNGDGATDVVTMPDLWRPTIYLGNGDGSLRIGQTNFGAGGGDLAVADVNGDGVLDLCISSSYGDDWESWYGQITVFPGRGDGSFGPAEFYPSGGRTSTYSIDLGDFNSDGFPDVALTDAMDYVDVFVMLNDSVGTTPPPPSLSVSDATVTEGNAGTTSAVFTVNLSAASNQSVTVRYTTTDGTATGGDYQATAGTLTFAPGETSKRVTVLVNGDRLLEPNEDFLVNLSDATRATIADGQGVGTILDDEPRISITDATVTEGNSGARAAIFTVTLSNSSSEEVTVYFTSMNGYAWPGSDYQETSGTLVFAPGETSKPVTVLVMGDRIAEQDENFFVNLRKPTNALIADEWGGGFILDDEPRINIDRVTKAEGNKGQTTLFTFTVTLSAAYDQPVTVSFRTTDYRARAGEDYTAKSGTLTFAPGETTKTITIAVKGDNKREGNESFFVDLSGNSGNSLITYNRGIGWILDDD